MKGFKFVVVSTIGALLTMGLAAAPAGAAPLVNVTPNTGLLDADQVSVTASGYTADAFLAVIECATGATSQDDCDLSTVSFANADSSGNLSTTYAVFREIFTANDQAGLDCAPSNCLLAVANVSNQTEAAAAPIAFDASVPLPPHLEITATINSAGSFDRSGNVTITGTITCNIPADVEIYDSIIQRSGRLLLHADGYSDISCDGATRYSLTATPYDGIFKGGNASVQLNFDSFSGRRGVFGTVNATVKLHGSTK
ncbi:MAG: hypothetical protein QOG50_1141 [Actinomycetota bacterium]|nr:hypothetical protein [Actinomycetota bacterium]